MLSVKLKECMNQRNKSEEAGIVRFAIVGCGHIGKRHLEMMSKDPRGKVVALCDVREPDELNLPQEAMDLPFYQDIEQLLSADLGIDLVSICTPNGLHGSMGRQVLLAGYHVLIEKPMVLDLAEGELLRQAQEVSGRRIFGVLQNRYTPSSVWLKGLIEGGVLGKIYDVRMQCLWNRDERYYLPRNWHGTAELDGGTLFTQYSHFVDLLNWWFSPIDRIHFASFANHSHGNLIDFEDTGEASFDFQSGSRGHLSYSTAVYGRNLEVGLTVLAENGCVRLGGPFLNQVLHCEIRNYQMPPIEASTPGNQYGGYSGSAQNHHLVIRHVIASLLGEKSEVVGLDEGLSVVETIRKIYSHPAYAVFSHNKQKER